MVLPKGNCASGMKGWNMGHGGHVVSTPRHEKMQVIAVEGCWEGLSSLNKSLCEDRRIRFIHPTQLAQCSPTVVQY